MVDCGSPRCAQERRSFRRDLQTWNKKLTLVLGLERIAADYVDEDTSKQLLNPYPEWEQEMCQDFDPSKRCFHCDKKLPNVYKRIQRIIDEAKRGKESNGRICLRSLQDLMPFSLDFYTHGFGQELFSDVVKTYFLTGLQQPEPKEEQPPTQPLPLPLFVSVSLPDGDPSKIKVPQPSPKSIRNHKTSEALHLDFREELDQVPSSSHSSNKPHCLRGTMLYDPVTVKPDPDQIIITDDEEEADFVHHRRGKMDFYKYPPPSPLPGLSYPEQAAALYAMGEMMLPAPPLGFMPYPFSIQLDSEDHDKEVESRLSHIRRMHNLNGTGRSQPRPAHANQLRLPLLMDVVRKLVRQKFLEIKQNHSKKQQPSPYEAHQERPEADLFSPFGPYLPAFTPLLSASPDSEAMSSPLYKHIMESIYANMMREETPLPKPFGKVNESSRIGDTLKDIIARTITEKMRFRDTSSDENSVPSSPDAHRLNGNRTGHGAFILNTTLPHVNKESKLLGECSPPKRAKKDSAKFRNSNGSKQELTDANGQPVKKTRPKRGQYRKYNSQLLMDAVKAVQRGEMSVHRAGSYFGVPHSTLEYKVKERHLLRQKKPRESQSPSGASKNGDTPPTTTGPSQAGDSSNGSTPADSCNTTKKPTSVSSPARSLSSSPTSTAATFTASLSKKSSTALSIKPPVPPQSTSPFSSAATSPSSSSALVPPLPHQSKESASLTWFPPYLGSASIHLKPPAAFTPPSLSLNNSASELLRKLQHKVQTKESTYTRESAFDFPMAKDHHVFDLTQSSSSVSVVPERLALYNHPV